MSRQPSKVIIVASFWSGSAFAKQLIIIYNPHVIIFNDYDSSYYTVPLQLKQCSFPIQAKLENYF